MKSPPNYNLFVQENNSAALILQQNLHYELTTELGQLCILYILF